ncbi:molybdate ABC transporter substrate-binding protein [Shouchella shacheensis]|uniref:molybdate ABC transporter substrate-binding protein n=1 Tax=Shouchella shacheensis TaxID=1649580 RepID=UPI0007402C9C|nr:molybdate ABC transporter substrate-binding protein [Shouchella shacheensis]
MEPHSRRGKRIGLAILLLTTFLLSGCRTQAEEAEVELVVSAAASLKESMEEVEQEFSRQHPEIRLIFNYGGSGGLRRQIEQRAPVDLFLSASKQHYEELVQKGLLLESEGAFIHNALVAVAHHDSELGEKHVAWSEAGRMAVATPEIAPAGRYTEQVLTSLGLWDTLQDQLVFGKDVRHVLTMVEQQGVEIGFVYQSDMEHAQQVELIHEFDSSLHEPIGYFAGVLESSEHQAEAILFEQFLREPEVQAIFRDHGFASSDTEAKR